MLVALAVFSMPAVRRCPAEEGNAEERKTPLLRIVVMDPLAAPLSCACVEGHGQRKYDRLASFLERELGRDVQLVFEESLGLAYKRAGKDVALIVGRRSMVEFDARRAETEVRPLLMLTDSQGRAGHTGLFLVRSDDAAKTIAELKGRRVALASEEHQEACGAAKQRLRALGILDTCRVSTLGSMDAAVFALVDGEADAALVSDSLPVLLEACGKVKPGSLRSIGATAAVPGVGVFATARLSAEDERQIRAALAKVAGDKSLLEALESKRGFVALEEAKQEQEAVKTAALWTDWRGLGRRGWCATLPKSLPERPRVVWRAKVTGPALAGIAATDRFVVVPDKDTELTTDVFRCFRAADGREVWKLEYPAAGKVDYTNAPRATPVIHAGKVYLQGALGHLHCVELATGRVIWNRNILSDFGADPLTWGCSIPPLVFDDKLLVTPGVKDASLAALSLENGETVWKSPGHAAAYAPFVVGTFGGVRQLVGYDVAGLGGWDPKTGRRLWEMVPPGQSDFNVVTPVVHDGGVLLATENNATRFYGFDKQGRLRPEPAAKNDDLAPDTSSPVIVGQRLFDTAYGELFCLDLKTGLKTVWVERDDMFFDHTNLIAGPDRVLLWTTTGDLLLIRADVDRYEVVSKLKPLAGDDVESMSHPAIVGDRLYLRSQHELVCLEIRL